jgi:hypothetical protein
MKHTHILSLLLIATIVGVGFAQPSRAIASSDTTSTANWSPLSLLSSGSLLIAGVSGAATKKVDEIKDSAVAKKNLMNKIKKAEPNLLPTNTANPQVKKVNNRIKKVLKKIF